MSEGLEIKIARLRAGLKQYDLAGRLGIRATALSEMEADRRPIPPEVAELIEKVLNEAQKVNT